MSAEQAGPAQGLDKKKKKKGEKGLTKSGERKERTKNANFFLRITSVTSCRLLSIFLFLSTLFSIFIFSGGGTFLHPKRKAISVRTSRVIERECAGDGLVSGPCSNGQHGNPSILDLLNAQAPELLALQAALALREAQRIEAVVSREPASDVVLAVVSSSLKSAGNYKDLEPARQGDHLDSI